MGGSPEVLAETVRARRHAIDNDLELLRVRLRKADPRRLRVRGWAAAALPVAVSLAGIWLWTRRRRVNSLDDLLVSGLADLHDAEQQLVPALGKMSAQAANPELQHALDQHRQQTEAQIDRLRRVFRSIGARPRRGRSRSIDAALAQFARVLKRKADPDVRDAWLIASAQRVEHLEIAAYAALQRYAETLGYTYAAQLLQQTLEEELAADETLARLADRFVNPQAIRAGGHASPPSAGL
jgi:ferritin-like metal-binding protein YciE